MGILTLISTATASGASSVDITSGIDSTYDEYMFVGTDIHPSQTANFQFQVNIADASGFNETMTTTVFDTLHSEDDSQAAMAYSSGEDQAQGTAYQNLGNSWGAGSDESGVFILHLFSPANTTYVTHFYATTSHLKSAPHAQTAYAAGYINATGAVDEISFKMGPAGTFDGVIQMYGIS